MRRGGEEGETERKRKRKSSFTFSAASSASRLTCDRGRNRSSRILSSYGAPIKSASLKRMRWTSFLRFSSKTCETNECYFSGFCLSDSLLSILAVPSDSQSLSLFLCRFSALPFTFPFSLSFVLSLLFSPTLSLSSRFLSRALSLLSLSFSPFFFFSLPYHKALLQHQCPPLLHNPNTSDDPLLQIMQLLYLWIRLIRYRRRRRRGRRRGRCSWFGLSDVCEYLFQFRETSAERLDVSDLFDEAFEELEVEDRLARWSHEQRDKVVVDVLRSEKQVLFLSRIRGDQMQIEATVFLITFRNASHLAFFFESSLIKGICAWTVEYRNENCKSDLPTRLVP